MDEVVIYILHISKVKDNTKLVLSFIDEIRKQKALRYINEKDQLLSLGAAYLLKKYLPAGEIKTTSNGKPYLDGGPFFNLSHSGEYAVLGIHPTRDVGIDIERIDDKKLDAIRFVLNEEESKFTNVEDLFKIWSNKESLIKCLSTLINDIKKVNGLPLDGVRDCHYRESLIHDGYSLSLTLKGIEPFKIKIQNVDIVEE